jgi:hypothetical protein
VLAAFTFYADLIVRTAKLKLRDMIIVKGKHCLRNADKKICKLPTQNSEESIVLSCFSDFTVSGWTLLNSITRNGSQAFS